MGQRFVLDVRGNNLVFKVLDASVIVANQQSGEPSIKAGMQESVRIQSHELINNNSCSIKLIFYYRERYFVQPNRYHH